MTPENVQRILTALRAGNTRKAAAGYGHVDQGTLENWMKRYADFSGQVKLAEDEAEVTVVSNLLAQIQRGDTRAMMFWLERRRHDSWSERINVSASGSVGVVVEYLNGSAPVPALSNGVVHHSDA